MTFVKRLKRLRDRTKKTFAFDLSSGERYNLDYKNGICEGTSIVKKTFKGFINVAKADKIKDGYFLFLLNNIACFEFPEKEEYYSISDTNDPSVAFCVDLVHQGIPSYYFYIGKEPYIFRSDGRFVDISVKGEHAAYFAGRFFIADGEKIYYSAYLKPEDFTDNSGGGYFYHGLGFGSVKGIYLLGENLYFVCRYGVFYLKRDGTGFKICDVKYKFSELKEYSAGIVGNKLLLISDNKIISIKNGIATDTDISAKAYGESSFEGGFTDSGYFLIKLPLKNELLATDGETVKRIKYSGFYYNYGQLISEDNLGIGIVGQDESSLGEWTSEVFDTGDGKLKTGGNILVTTKKPCLLTVITDKAVRNFDLKSGENKLELNLRFNTLKIKISTPSMGQEIKNLYLTYYN